MMWEKTTIGKHCTVTSSKRFHLSDRSDSGIPFYCSKEIIQKVNGQEITDYDYIKVEAYEEVKMCIRDSCRRANSLRRSPMIRLAVNAFSA